MNITECKSWAVIETPAKITRCNNRNVGFREHQRNKQTKSSHSPLLSVNRLGLSHQEFWKNSFPYIEKQNGPSHHSCGVVAWGWVWAALGLFRDPSQTAPPNCQRHLQFKQSISFMVKKSQNSSSHLSWKTHHYQITSLSISEPCGRIN